MNKPLSAADMAAQTQGIASQATHIEKSRAVAEVQGALVVAQRFPRDQGQAMQMIRDACQTTHLAERAFFSFSRGGQTVAGPSVHFATEIARCWGNVLYGIVETAREARQSEMMAYAWDLQTNTRVVNSFIVPHRRDTRSGGYDLTDARDIYENNANQAARRLRECILRILPSHVREEAIAICRKTLHSGGGVPLAERREKMLEMFAGVGVSKDMIEAKRGRRTDALTEVDVADLGIVFRSIRNGETTVAAHFPQTEGAKAKKAIEESAFVDGDAPPDFPGMDEDAAALADSARQNGMFDDAA